MPNQPAETIIHSRAPLRICDLGGWTDTWFAGYGQLLNIAIAPFVEVQVVVRRAAELPSITIAVENFQLRYQYRPGEGWERHPLIEAAIDRADLPPGLGLEISIFSSMPAGASTGTSAAVVVALLGALDRLTTGRMDAYALAQASWAVETEMLGQQSGIQDQLAAAFGGINFITMEHYPQASVAAVELPHDLRRELERRLLLVYLGSAHRSTEVHEMVIQRLENSGPQAQELVRLRSLARSGRAALLQGDFAAFGAAMIANHEAQRGLHPGLINAAADRIAELARSYGVLGWKTNGAGGPGGSLTLLCGPRADDQRALLQAIEQAGAGIRVIPLRLARSGLQVWETA